MKLVLHRIGILQIIFIFLFPHFISAQNTVPAMEENTYLKNFTTLYNTNHPISFSKNKNITTTVMLPKGFPAGNEQYKEVPSKRTHTSRTFVNNAGGIVVQNSSTHLNYLDKKNKFQPINTQLETYDTSTISKNELTETPADGKHPAWAALAQQYPTYLFFNGSTALSSEENKMLVFNHNCKINNQTISISDFTVGNDGMLINNAISGIDKKIIFSENAIKTDYIIKEKMNLTTEDLIFSEEIRLPEGYDIMPLPTRPSPKESNQIPTIPCALEEGEGKTMIVYSRDGKEQARFKTPIFYDANKIAITGKYTLLKNDDGFILEFTVPNQWLNDSTRAYPITIDPLVTGPVSNFPANFMNSCVAPNYATDSMQVTIPAGITITSFIVEDSYFADALSTPAALMRHGTMELSTACGTVTFSCQGTASDSSGTCYLVPNTDVKTDLACCFSPSCTDQTFYITHGLSRDTYGPGCNQNYIYYSPFSTWPFSAFIVGKTVETTQTQWSVFPATICSDSCTIYLKATTKYGVPPYTITHPWATGASQFGSFSGCNSIGTDTITLVIPGCPSTCGTNPTLIIPAPTIVDACGDSVSGLTSKTIIINPVPVATATVREVCAGAPFTIPVSSCVTGSSYTWTGDNGSNGVGNISDVAQTNVTSPTLINYSIIPTANGCVGAAISVSADINPLPILIASPNDTIDPGISVPLNATGGLTYSWTPTTALSCATCANPIAAPVVSTTYIVTGNNEYECSSSDTLTLIVNQGTEVLYIPNSFTPNSNDLNDLFCVYGTSIKKIDLEIFDRWGELLFKTTDITMGWDGTFHGKPVEKGVYVYSIRCEWESGTHTYRTGTVTIVP